MDVFGEGLRDFFNHGSPKFLTLYSSYDAPGKMPLAVFFREEEEMPDLEYKALEMCKGRVLDIGAGAGSHVLELQKMGLEVTALDSSPAAVTIMKERGVKQVVLANFEEYNGGLFDTILLLMNGIGVAGTLEGLRKFLERAKSMIHPHGQLIFDSSDLNYLYELYDYIKKPLDKYYGEVCYQYAYKNKKGSWFNWVFVDEHTLTAIAKESGWNCEIIFDDGEDQYLAHLTLA